MGEKRFGLMRLCSRLIKVAAWTFLLLGASSGIATLVSPSGNTPRWMGVYFILIYAFAFLLIYFISLIGDLLLEIWQFLKKERF